MARRHYTAKERAQATGIAVVEGVTEAERRTGIAKNTIQYWTQKPEFVHLRTTARETVVEQFWVGIQVGLEQVIAGLKGDAPLNHKAEATRMLADRFALLNGEATDRTETRDLSDRLDDHERAVLGDAIRDELARRADETAAVPAVGDPSSTGATPTDG